jgi:hypothetical protein
MSQKFLSYNLVEHYFSLFLQKKAEKNYVKSLIMLQVQSPENLPEKLPIFVGLSFINYYSNCRNEI